jgi:hypothetical protein
MPHLTDLTGLASAASAITVGLLLFSGIARIPKTYLAMLLGAVFTLVLIPFGTIPLAAYVRGVTGELSITTLVLLWCALLRPWCNSIQGDSRFALSILIVGAALALYPMALGMSAYDPYRLGYGNPLFVTILLLLALLAWFRKFPIIALCIAFATLAWAVGWYESDNLWDYLIDPFVTIYALSSLTIRLVMKAQHKNVQVDLCNDRNHK